MNALARWIARAVGLETRLDNLEARIESFEDEMVAAHAGKPSEAPIWYRQAVYRKLGREIGFPNFADDMEQPKPKRRVQ